MKLITLLFLVSLSSAQEFLQVGLRSIVRYPYEDGPNKFQVKYISPTKSPPQDSIFEEKVHLYNDVQNHWLDRYSIFRWKDDPKEFIFYTSHAVLRYTPGYRYNYYDPNPEEKGTLYITEDLFRKGGQVIIYCEGVKKTDFTNPDTVLVSIFNMDNWVDPLNFSFYEKVYKNTTFLLFSGKTGANTYLRIDMYEGSTFVKNVYKWDSITGVGTGTGYVTAIKPKLPTLTIFSPGEFDLTGRKIIKKGLKRGPSF